jgi:hypothetical protein
MWQEPAFKMQVQRSCNRGAGRVIKSSGLVATPISFGNAPNDTWLPTKERGIKLKKEVR